MPTIRRKTNSYQSVLVGDSMTVRPFKSDLILEEKISEATLRGYYVGFDQNKFRLEPLVNVISDVITEFALGLHSGTSVLITEMRAKLKEAAELVFTTDKYKQRGEFGELVLHLLLRDWCGTIPLISKIRFKDAHNATVHGFDAVHITLKDKKLWLGESKLYTSGAAGVTELAADLRKHLENDYLRREFTLISPKLPENTPEIDHWRTLLHRNQRLETILAGICIPMVCTYSSDLYKTHTDNTPACITAFTDECKKLAAEFEKKKIETDVDVILMLLPVPSKDELNAELFKRLKHMQAI